jgi:hypothetical protein
LSNSAICAQDSDIQVITKIKTIIFLMPEFLKRNNKEKPYSFHQANFYIQQGVVY